MSCFGFIFPINGVFVYESEGLSKSWDQLDNVSVCHCSGRMSCGRFSEDNNLEVFLHPKINVYMLKFKLFLGIE